MVDAVIVIEAAERGGALITAELANGYNREVFAVPGKTNDRFSVGCNKLIRNHKANIYTKPEDIPYLLGWPEGDEDTGIEKTSLLEKLPEKEKTIMSLLISFPEGLMFDELSWKSHLPVNELASLLLHLEIDGYVLSLPGKKYSS